MKETSTDTLRLLFPQWQGGNNPPYSFGSELLNWLAPVPSGPVESVEVAPFQGKPLKNEQGIMGRSELLRNASNAASIIEKHRPEKIVTLGGDCGVSLTPFSYLNNRYDGNLAVLWLDTHPDVMTPKVFENAHAMVMGSLLGEGDPDFLKFVPRPIKPQNTFFAGVRETGKEWAEIRKMEAEVFDKLGLKSAGPIDLEKGNAPILEWIEKSDIDHLAIHFDLDVLDPDFFRSLLFANPLAPMPSGTPSGKLKIQQVLKLFDEVSRHTNIVGLTIAEHMPWDSLALKSLLGKLPLLGESG